jgi:hypothetical protein
VKDFKTENGQHSIIKGTMGTYATPPHLLSGQVDLKKLMAELKDIHANTYNWLIWKDDASDLAALKRFLPLAREVGLKVWVTLVPPSESPPSKPFGLDYNKWASELAKLSKKEPNLIAWSIDDFVHNLKFFSPEYVKEFLSLAHAINPKLMFVPCCYYRSITDSFVKKYVHLFDGVLFPYRAESEGANLKDPTLVNNEVTRLRNLFKPEFPIILDVYATAHSRLGSTTPEYVREVIDAGLKHADGVLIFTHQDPAKNAEKYKIIREAFAKGFNKKQ